MSAAAPGQISRGDRAALWFFIVAGGVIVIASAVFATRRIIELARGGAVDVPVEFIDQQVTAPLGAGGADVTIALDRAVLHTEIPAASTVAGILAQIILFATFAVVITCLILLTRRLTTGKIFGRTSTRLVSLAGMTGLLGAAATRFFENMVANGAIAHVSDHEYSGNAILSISLFPFIVAAFAVAVICSVFVVGDRLQRETEGLV